MHIQRIFCKEQSYYREVFLQVRVLCQGNIFPDAGSICFENKDLLVNCEIRKEFGILIQPSF